LNEYNDKFRLILQGKILEIEALQKLVMDSVNTPSEGEVRSVSNEQIAFKMGELGENVDKVEGWALETKDLLAYRREKEKMKLMSEIDPKTGKGPSATYAETQANLDLEIAKLTDESRKLNHAATVLKHKSNAIWSWLDQSRSRLTWIKGDIHNA